MTDTQKTSGTKSEKTAAPPTEKTTAGAPDKTPTTEAAEKPDAAKETAKSYSRGEGQKPVTHRYRSNWDTVFGKKKR